MEVFCYARLWTQKRYEKRRQEKGWKEKVVAKFKKVAKTKRGVPKKYLSNARNPAAKEREILETKRRYKLGLPIDVKKVSKSRASQNKTKVKRRKRVS